MRFAWLTDIHVNFLTPKQLDAFIEDVRGQELDGVLIGGDIAEAPSLADTLRLLEARWQMPIWFVLGNHDFYRGSIETVRGDVRRICKVSSWLRWLPTAGVIPIAERTALVGHDGWADGRLGTGSASRVELNDFHLIREFRSLLHFQRYELMAQLADSAVEALRPVLEAALDRMPNVLLLTHVPPFRAACRHEGRISEPEFLPLFGSKVMGDMLVEVMDERPDSRLTVLCGHTHSAADVEILPNLRVLAGQAEYGAPVVQTVFELS